MSLVEKIDATVFSRYRNMDVNYDNLFEENPVKSDILKDMHMFVPENLSWILYLEDRRFQFVGTTSTFGHLSNILFLHFVKLVPDCFVDSYLKSIGAFVSLYASNDGHHDNEKTQLQLLIPMKLSCDDYYYVKQTISPKILNNQLYGLQIVNIPIKHYEEDYYKIEVFNRGITD
ncbi:hypothetical protein OOZ15_19795, partial [Galbibacter sp. EGI 63066]|uniref:hypothetical protein n=1 Tax=Galbibacter sp. EGI 63066 TaxID=2993559 RepID=UPI0022489359